MKKIAIMIFLATILIVGCNKQDDTEKTKDTLAITYSNLVDDESQNIVKEALKEANISESASNNLFASINLFNNSVDKTGLTKGFETKNTKDIDYDFGKISDMWDAKNSDFIGFNCRLTTFTIAQEFVEADKIIEGDTDILIFDKDSLSNAPFEIMDNATKEKFLSFYSSVPTEKTKDINVHIQKIKDFMKEKGIKFTNDDVSVISVYFQDDSTWDKLFIGHTGLLFEKDNEIYFMEKIAFQEPYQLIKFTSRAEVSNYLMDKYNFDSEFEHSISTPIIFENDDVIEGYNVVGY